MEENKQLERKVIKISKMKLIVSVVALVIILVLVSIALSSMSNARSKGTSSNSQSVIPSLGSSYGDSVNETAMPTDNYRYQEQNSSISDTREFLKTNYDSTIKTRKVSNVITSVKNIVKGSDGRVDRFYSSEKYGTVSFVVAKSKFDAFRDEVESITHKKLYVESISSQNLLTEKQGIEGQIVNANQSLDSLISQRTELTNNHNKIVASINKELKRIESELSYYRAAILVEKDISLLNEIRKTENSLVQQQTYQKKILGDENINYNSEKQNFDSMISNASNNLTDINKQDGKFMDNIETVNGEVYVQWVSLWEMAVIFSPIHPVLIIIILIIAGFVLFRKRLPKVEIV